MKTLLTLIIALVLGFASVAKAEDPPAVPEKPQDVRAIVSERTQLQNQLRYTLSKLNAAKRSVNPDQKKINQLNQEADDLRNKLGIVPKKKDVATKNSQGTVDSSLGTNGDINNQDRTMNKQGDPSEV